jgi:hypothetical protein
MRNLARFTALTGFLLPAGAFAGSAVTDVTEPGLLSLLAAGGVALALIGKFRKK